ncbi:hypothetical protein DPSP01_001310 [Paraphaeosphaeria sporulosa]
MQGLAPDRRELLSYTSLEHLLLGDALQSTSSAYNASYVAGHLEPTRRKLHEMRDARAYILACSRDITVSGNGLLGEAFVACKVLSWIGVCAGAQVRRRRHDVANFVVLASKTLDRLLFATNPCSEIGTRLKQNVGCWF